LAEHRSYEPKVTGSTPVGSNNGFLQQKWQQGPGDKIWRQCPKLRSLLISKESSKTIGNLQQLPKALLALDAGSTPVAAYFRIWDGPIGKTACFQHKHKA
tara:strand:- start:90 stop:389 length:300 start_codon:yes stop_codon:yes gene_type:complete